MYSCLPITACETCILILITVTNFNWSCIAKEGILDHCVVILEYMWVVYLNQRGTCGSQKQHSGTSIKQQGTLYAQGQLQAVGANHRDLFWITHQNNARSKIFSWWPVHLAVTGYRCMENSRFHKVGTVWLYSTKYKVEIQSEETHLPGWDVFLKQFLAASFQVIYFDRLSFESLFGVGQLTADLAELPHEIFLILS